MHHSHPHKGVPSHTFTPNHVELSVRQVYGMGAPCEPVSLLPSIVRGQTLEASKQHEETTLTPQLATLSCASSIGSVTL
jgi:hypothetical protein